MARILIVDDEPRMAQVIAKSLALDGHETETAGDGSAALEMLRASSFDLVLTDQRMEPMDGMELLKVMRDEMPSVPVVMMTAYGEIPNAVEAMHRGAAYYLTKPVDLDDVRVVLERALEERDLRQDADRTRTLRSRAAESWELVGDGAAMRAVKGLVLRVAPTDATVLIRGESGTGKELCAKAIHRHSGRADGPFVAVNCGAIPDSLLESELFGYKKGAFTGADADKAGFFELANKGTLFLDEIGEANLGVQTRLLRALQERRFLPVGGRSEIAVDVRIVAATNQDLERAIEEERFREDLYYRFNVFPIEMPPLRARTEDIPALAEALLGDLGYRGPKLGRDVIAALQAHPWPGNVRELRNVLERATILAGPEPIGVEHLILGPTKTVVADPEPVDLDLQANERRFIRIALRRAGGNKTRAAEMLGLTRRALYSRMERLGIDDETGAE